MIILYLLEGRSVACIWKEILLQLLFPINIVFISIPLYLSTYTSRGMFHPYATQRDNKKFNVTYRIFTDQLIREAFFFSAKDRDLAMREIEYD